MRPLLAPIVSSLALNAVVAELTTLEIEYDRGPQTSTPVPCATLTESVKIPTCSVTYKGLPPGDI